MRTILLIIIIVLCPAIAFGSPAMIQGTVQGYNCIIQGKTCPTGMEDPLAATEAIFVVLTPDNKFYFVPNLDRTVMARHVNEQVRISGDLDPGRSLIRAQRLEILKNGQWMTVWTPQMERLLMDPALSKATGN